MKNTAGKTIILARIRSDREDVRSVRGRGDTELSAFALFNVIGGCAWVAVFCYAGFCSAVLDVVQENLKLLIVVIIVVSILPAVIEIWRNKRKKK